MYYFPCVLRRVRQVAALYTAMIYNMFNICILCIYIYIYTYFSVIFLYFTALLDIFYDFYFFFLALALISHNAFFTLYYFLRETEIN